MLIHHPPVEEHKVNNLMESVLGKCTRSNTIQVIQLTLIVMCVIVSRIRKKFYLISISNKSTFSYSNIKIFVNTYKNSRVNIFTAYFHKLNMITFLIISTLRKKNNICKH